MKNSSWPSLSRQKSILARSPKKSIWRGQARQIFKKKIKKLILFLEIKKKLSYINGSRIICHIVSSLLVCLHYYSLNTNLKILYVFFSIKNEILF